MIDLSFWLTCDLESHLPGLVRLRKSGELPIQWRLAYCREEVILHKRDSVIFACQFYVSKKWKLTGKGRRKRRNEHKEKIKQNKEQIDHWGWGGGDGKQGVRWVESLCPDSGTQEWQELNMRRCCQYSVHPSLLKTRCIARLASSGYHSSNS